MRRFTLSQYVLAFLLTLQSAVSYAQWFESTGEASLSDVSYVEAREAARQDALAKAMRAFIERKEHNSLVNGRIEASSDSLASRIRVREERIKHEHVAGDYLSIQYAVDLDASSECLNSDAGRFKKSVAVLGFNLQVPDQASIGRLNGVEQGLSSALSSALSQVDSLSVLQQADVGAYRPMINAPTQVTEQRLLSHAMQEAKKLNVQFVVSGVVRDMGLVNPKAYETSVWRKSIKFFAQADERRRFSVDLFVHDGLTGELVWQENFATQGDWSPDLSDEIGFATQAFWKTSYGLNISNLLESMSFALDEQLRCQPFMTRIARVDGKTIHFSSGASVGLRPGDKLSVYRSFNFYDALQQKGLELTNTKAVLTVSQVHPNFASGKIGLDPGRLNIQQDDVLIVW